MSYTALGRRLPSFLRRHILHFETSIEDAVRAFAAGVPTHALVLDAGAGEGRYSSYFSRQTYVGVDLGVGDSGWNYSELDALADLSQLPFRGDTFAAAINIVTLEHVREPQLVMAELARTLAPGGRLLLIVPHEWEEHQQPHDYFRYTQYGLRYLVEKSGMRIESIEPVGGYFRLMGRRALNGIQFFPGLWSIFGALLLGLPGVILPLFDFLDKKRNFTLGYICIARKSGGV